MCGFGHGRYASQLVARRAAELRAHQGGCGVFVGPNRTYKVHEPERDLWAEREVRAARLIAGKSRPPLARYHSVRDFPNGAVMLTMETLPEPGPFIVGDEPELLALYEEAQRILGNTTQLFCDIGSRHVRLDKRGRPRIFDLEGPNA